MSDDIEHIRVWHRTWADSDKSELDALRAENERLRLGIGRAMDRLRTAVRQDPSHIEAMNCLLDALESDGKDAG